MSGPDTGCAVVGGRATMCPVATVTAEIADTEPGLREVAAEVVRTWVEQGARYLTGRGLAEPAARSVIHAVLAALEGAFVLARGLRTREPFHAAGRAGRVRAWPRCRRARGPEAPSQAG